jgi:hypothetical protein
VEQVILVCNDANLIAAKILGERGWRRAVRPERSKPLVLALKAWLEQQLARVSAKATIAGERAGSSASSCVWPGAWSLGSTGLHAVLGALGIAL